MVITLANYQAKSNQVGLSLGGILLANKDMLNPMPSVHESQDRII